MCADGVGNVFVAGDGNDPALLDSRLGRAVPAVVQIGSGLIKVAHGGLPAEVRCSDIQYDATDQSIVLVTCGRSLWKFDDVK